jgi:NADPH-dependent curcumin reductase CurA
MQATSREVHLLRHPNGWPTTEDFRVTDVELPDLRPGEVRVENEFMSVDPYMRSRMSGYRTYIDPFELNEAMTGGAVGRVVASRSDDLPEGSLVLHDLGWRTVAQARAEAFRRVTDVPDLPSSVHLGMLGLTGFTAWVGLLDIARMQEGETVFVSGAAGAVGSAVGQIARLRGASRVIGSAGGPEKSGLLVSRYGYDTGLDYKEGDIGRQLRDAAPDGIDVFFDNVGGDHLQAAVSSMKDFGRAAICGSISNYNSTTDEPGPSNLSLLVVRRLTLAGFIVYDHQYREPAFLEEMGEWLSTGAVTYDETVVPGIDNAVDAFLGLMRGGNIGKMLVTP